MCWKDSPPPVIAATLDEALAESLTRTGWRWWCFSVSRRLGLMSRRCRPCRLTFTDHSGIVNSLLASLFLLPALLHWWPLKASVDVTNGATANALGCSVGNERLAQVCTGVGMVLTFAAQTRPVAGRGSTSPPTLAPIFEEQGDSTLRQFAQPRADDDHRAWVPRGNHTAR
jgi:hypothetical protein